MDYHIENLGEFVKPLFFWTAADFLSYMQYIDALSEAIKLDYQTIADHKNQTGEDLLTDEQRQTVQHAIVDWASQQQVFLDDSENTAFPFASDINKADYQFATLSTASDIVTAALASVGKPSQSQEKKEEVQPSESPEGSFMGNLKDLVKWGVIGIGVWIAYSIYKDIRR